MYCVFYPFFVEYILDACWSTHNVVPMPKSWNIFLHLYVVCISLQYVPFEIYFYIYLIVLYVILNIKLPLVFIKVCIWGSWLFSVFYCKLALHINMIFLFLWTSRKKYLPNKKSQTCIFLFICSFYSLGKRNHKSFFEQRCICSYKLIKA